MSTTHGRDTLEALWEVVQPHQFPSQAIRGVTLKLDYHLDPETDQIAYAVSLELISPCLRRLYNWKGPSTMHETTTQRETEETWQGLVLGLAATVTGIILPGKE